MREWKLGHVAYQILHFSGTATNGYTGEPTMYEMALNIMLRYQFIFHFTLTTPLTNKYSVYVFFYSCSAKLNGHLF